MAQYNAVNILKSLDEIGTYNTQTGVPKATKSGIKANNKAAANSSKTTLGINDAASRSVSALLANLNSKTSRWAASEAQAINAQAAAAAAEQSIELNRRAAGFASETANAANQAATQFGVKQAKTQGEDLNLFSTLNTAYLNNNIAVPAANEAAGAFNESATNDVLASQAAMFGGGDAFGNFQKQVNANLQDKLAGNVSQSTRRGLARQAISGGNTQFGGGSVNDAYAGYLGLTKEQLQAQGQQQYESLYSLYRQSVPIVSGADLLPHYGLSNQYTSQQAYGSANRLAEMGGISANNLLNLSGTSADRLTTMGGLQTESLYGTNALSGDRLFAANQLSNESLFAATMAPTRDLLGLTTLDAAKKIGFDIQQAENEYQASANNEARRDALRSNQTDQTDQTANQKLATARGPGSGNGPGGGLRTGGLSTSRFSTLGRGASGNGGTGGRWANVGRTYSAGGGYSGGTAPYAYGGSRF